MTPVERGRHCAHCQKTVTDFSGWSDAELYRYLTEQKGGACGRFLLTQLNRPIHIPHQPHSRLYAMTIALGLTVVFLHGGEARAQSRPPLVQQVAAAQQRNTDTSNNQSGSISGTVSDEKKEPLISAMVQVYQGGVLKGGAVADFDGHFEIKRLPAGKYDLLFSYYGYDSVGVDEVIVVPDECSIVNIDMKPLPNMMNEITVVSYTVGLIKYNGATNDSQVDSTEIQDAPVVPINK